MDKLNELFELIGVLCQRRYQAAEKHFSALGLNHTEARLLRLLDRSQGEARQDALSNAVFVDRSNVGRALNGLEKKELVKRSTSQSDKRARNVRLTAKGKQTVTKLSKARAQIVEGFFGGLSDEDAGAVAAILRNALGDEVL